MLRKRIQEAWSISKACLLEMLVTWEGHGDIGWLGKCASVPLAST